MALDEFTQTQLEQYFKEKNVGYSYQDMRNVILTLQEIFGRDMDTLKKFLESTGNTITTVEQLTQAATKYAEESRAIASQANDKADNTQNQLDQVVNRATDSDAMSRQAAIDANGIDHENLKARNDSDYLSLNQNKASVEKVNNNANMYWIPPEQPPARTDIPGYIADGFGWTSDQFIDNLFEPLRLANPSYVTRDNLGKDASGTYDVWRYYFTPSNFTKTVVVGTGIHGSEATPIIATAMIMKEVINNWDKSPQLTWIRNNVRLIVLPCQNPWGTSQQPRKRQNSNGVDLNRNFDYKWADYVPQYNTPGGHDYKGAAPFSEVESQYIRNTLQQFKDASVYIDMHNFGAPAADYIVYNSANADNQFIYNDLIDYLTKGIADPIVINETQETPSAYNYATNVLKMVSGNPEWADRRFGGSQYNSVEITKAVEWFGNIIIQHAREDVFTPHPFGRELVYTRQTTNLTLSTGTSHKEIEELHFSFDAPSDGLVIFKGTVTIKGNDAASQHFICPVISQVGGDFSSFTPMTSRDEVYCEGNTAITLPYDAMKPVRKTEGSMGKVVLGIFGYTKSGTTILYRFKGKILFIPIEGKDRYSIYSAIGREGQGIGAMQQIYDIK